MKYWRIGHSMAGFSRPNDVDDAMSTPVTSAFPTACFVEKTALTTVAYVSETMAILLPVLHVHTYQDEEMDNVPALRRKLQRVQVSNLNLTRELERAERMLKAQVCAGFASGA